MKRIYILAICMGVGVMGAKENATKVAIVNGTSHTMEIALGSDYNRYLIPDYGPYSMTLPGPYEVSPWLTDWITIQPGKTYHFAPESYSVCPEYVVLRNACQLQGKRVTQFRNHTAVALLENPKEAGQYAAHTCSGDVTVTFADRKRAHTKKRKTGTKSECAARVTVAGSLDIDSKEVT